MLLRFFLLFFSVLSLTSARPPEVVPFGSVYNVELHESFLLACNIASGSKPIQFEWSRNGQILTQQSGLSVDLKPSSSSLTIDSIRQEHSGNYSCRASNRFGSDSQSTFLLVKGSSHSRPFGGANWVAILVIPPLFLLFFSIIFRPVFSLTSCRNHRQFGQSIVF